MLPPFIKGVLLALPLVIVDANAKNAVPGGHSDLIDITWVDGAVIATGGLLAYKKLGGALAVGGMVAGFIGLLFLGNYLTAWPKLITSLTFVKRT